MRVSDLIGRGSFTRSRGELKYCRIKFHFAISLYAAYAVKTVPVL